MDGPARIRGVGVADSAGVVRGAVTSVHDAASSIRAAYLIATTEAGVAPDEVYLAISGEHLVEHKVTAEVEIDGEVVEEDVEHILKEARKRAEDELVNFHIIHDIPQGFWVDSTKSTTSPLSLRGSRLGVSVLYIAVLTRDKEAAEAAVREAGLTLVETIAAPIASSLVTLTTLQKNAGSMHVLMGRDTTVATIFENGSPASLSVLPFGSNNITEDIALAVTVSLDEAERLKRHAHTELMKEKKKVLATIQKKHRAYASELRLCIDRSRRVLPGGIVLTGGGGQFPLLETHIRDFVRLPTVRATLPKAFGTNKKHLDAALTPAIGAALYGQLAEKDRTGRGAFGRWVKKVWRRLLAFLGTLLP